MTSERVFFEAELTPNRSLSRAGFWVIMAFIGFTNLFSAFAFMKVGALPIVGFLALDVLLVWLAFKVCFRSQTQKTRVRITHEFLRVDHLNDKGEESFVELPTAFARVELKEPVTHNSWLTLALKDKAYVIGRFLTPEERESLAEALRDALQRARRPVFND